MIKSKSKIFFLFIFMACSCQQEIKTNLKEHYTTDELKWMLYSINYTCVPQKVYFDQKQEKVTFVQCTYGDSVRKFFISKDTTVIMIRLFYKISDSLYTSLDYPYCSQLYFKNDTFLFPAGDMVLYHDLLDHTACQKFLQGQEIRFIDFLKNYHGKMNTWLYKECNKRNIRLNSDVIAEY